MDSRLRRNGIAFFMHSNPPNVFLLLILRFPVNYRGLQIIVTLFAVAALSSAPKDAGGDTGATEEVVTIVCNLQ